MHCLPRISLIATVLTATFAQAAPVTGQGTWETTLQARDILGHAVALDSASAAFFYDTTLNVTWLANMNMAGDKNWAGAVAWADALTTGGYTDWRLPTIIDSGTPGCNRGFNGTDCGYNPETEVGGNFSEWAHLFYVTLGNLGALDTNGNFRGGLPGSTYGLTNTAYFQNMMSANYWSGTEYAPNPASAWMFSLNSGEQFFSGKTDGRYVVAVRTGDVLRDGGTVPEPQSLALALVALTGLCLGTRRGRRT